MEIMVLARPLRRARMLTWSNRGMEVRKTDAHLQESLDRVMGAGLDELVASVCFRFMHGHG